MSAAPEIVPPTSEAEDLPAPPRQPTSPLIKVAAALVIAATSWFLLKEFAGLLRPLLMAVFLCYVIHPVYLRLRERITKPAAIAVMVGGSVGILYVLGLMVQVSVDELSEDLPRLTKRAQRIGHQVREFLDDYVPWLITQPEGNTARAEQRAARLRELTKNIVNVAADALAEAVVVGFYLLFLFLEMGQFPRRVQSAFGGERADHILTIFRNINYAIASYLRVKVKASLLLAVPVALVLWATGVRFAVLWGVLTFLCNFIPYAGSIIAVSLPLLFALLQLEPGWQPVAAVLGVVAIHVVMTYVVEPTLVGKGVGLSPLIILVALTFWGACWGLVGMFLAVPLTVMLKIVLENIPSTRAFTRLLIDE